MNVVDIHSSDKLDEIIEIRTILDSKDDIDVISSSLKRLSEIAVTLNDINVSKIGKSLKKLTKHSDKRISKQADDLVDKWKKSVKSEKPHEKKDAKSSTFADNNKKIFASIEDNLIQPFRNNVRKLMYQSILGKHEIESIS
jgi:hypothetical protein